jgi:hypothetical protein
MKFMASSLILVNGLIDLYLLSERNRKTATHLLPRRAWSRWLGVLFRGCIVF